MLCNCRNYNKSIIAFSDQKLELLHLVIGAHWGRNHAALCSICDHFFHEGGAADTTVNNRDARVLVCTPILQVSFISHIKILFYSIWLEINSSNTAYIHYDVQNHLLIFKEIFIYLWLVFLDIFFISHYLNAAAVTL